MEDKGGGGGGEVETGKEGDVRDSRNQQFWDEIVPYLSSVYQGGREGRRWKEREKKGGMEEVNYGELCNLTLSSKLFPLIHPPSSPSLLSSFGL